VITLTQLSINPIYFIKISSLFLSCLRQLTATQQKDGAKYIKSRIAFNNNVLNSHSRVQAFAELFFTPIKDKNENGIETKLQCLEHETFQEAAHIIDCLF
jgi:hypothetical protein